MKGKFENQSIYPLHFTLALSKTVLALLLPPLKSPHQACLCCCLHPMHASGITILLLGWLRRQLWPYQSPRVQPINRLKSITSARHTWAPTADPASLPNANKSSPLKLCPAGSCVAEADHPTPWYSECDLQTISICTAWTLVRDQGPAPL